MEYPSSGNKAGTGNLGQLCFVLFCFVSFRSVDQRRALCASFHDISCNEGPAGAIGNFSLDYVYVVRNTNDIDSASCSNSFGNLNA